MPITAEKYREAIHCSKYSYLLQDLRNIKKIHEMKNNPELFSSRKKIIQGRKPIKEKMLRRASQSLVIEKADMLLNLLETTDVRSEFRPKICLMIDNLISTVKRRAIKSTKKESNSQKKRQWIRQSISDITNEKESIGAQSGSNLDPSIDTSYSENLEFNNPENDFPKQTSSIRFPRSSAKEDSQKRIIFKFSH